MPSEQLAEFHCVVQQLNTNAPTPRANSKYPQAMLDWRKAASLYAGIVSQQGEYAAVTLQMPELGHC